MPKKLSCADCIQVARICVGDFVIEVAQTPYSSTDRQLPSFLHEPPNRHEFLNSSGAVIPCTAFGNPTPIVRWIHDDGTAASDIPGLRHARLDGSLVFQPFRADQYRQDVHATVYRCTASNVFGTLSSRDVNVVAGKTFTIFLQRIIYVDVNEFML
ncbi:hypothetical protein JTE90_027212 [Oedothorax gibbosus]|uniref:Ig-like domain-containing protein n=1 Tax=Oedothorax gibbosus TaxID=931172 RepID=A0AAV6UUL5_9ARAC|nr:hypothetical protein JTE90_027212 [Oedothorax gibbosus]